MSKTIRNIYFYIVVVYSGLSLTFFRSNESLIVLWLLGLIIFQKETFNTSKKLFVALGVWVGYFVINTVIIRSFHPMFFGTYVAKIMIAYWLLSYYKDNIFLKYENAIYTLTVISLLFYSIQVLFPGPMYELFKALDLSQNPFPDRIYASIGIYTYHRVGAFDSFPRNSGFCWEPGPFSSYVVLALFINIARNGVKIKDTKRFWVFLLAIISAQSSTSFVVLLAVIIWFAWSRYKNRAFRVFSVPVALAVVIYLFVNVPWLQDKIIEESEQDINELLVHAHKAKSGTAPGRFASLELRWMDFKKYPIAGFGGNMSLQTGYIAKDVEVSAISGIGNIIGRYGTIGSLLFLYLIFSTGKWLAKRYNYSGNIIFPLLILMIGFGFGIIESPLIATLWMTPFFINKKYLMASRVQFLRNDSWQLQKQKNALIE